MVSALLVCLICKLMGAWALDRLLSLADSGGCPVGRPVAESSSFPMPLTPRGMAVNPSAESALQRHDSSLLRIGCSAEGLKLINIGHKCRFNAGIAPWTAPKHGIAQEAACRPCKSSGPDDAAGAVVPLSRRHLSCRTYSLVDMVVLFNPPPPLLAPSF
jgi:hypothetical protein